MFKSLVLTLMACFGSSSGSFKYDFVKETKQYHYSLEGDNVLNQPSVYEFNQIGIFSNLKTPSYFNDIWMPSVSEGFTYEEEETEFIFGVYNVISQNVEYGWHMVFEFTEKTQNNILYHCLTRITFTNESLFVDYDILTVTYTTLAGILTGVTFWDFEQDNYYFNALYSTYPLDNTNPIYSDTNTWKYENIFKFVMFGYSYEFTFDRNFNPYFLWGKDSQTPASYQVPPGAGAVKKEVLNIGKFYCNGFYYEGIALVYSVSYSFINDYGEEFINEVDFEDGWNGYLIFDKMCFLPSLSDVDNIDTNHDNTTHVCSSSVSYAPYTHRSPQIAWKNTIYRQLKILKTSYADLEQINNFNESGNGHTQISNADVFSLLLMAFGGFTTFFSISILPGLSLGTFLFIPLTVLIVLAIVKLLKK